MTRLIQTARNSYSTLNKYSLHHVLKYTMYRVYIVSYASGGSA